MSKSGEITEATIARIAGNLLSGYCKQIGTDENAIYRAVAHARAIAAEVERTRPAARDEAATG